MPYHTVEEREPITTYEILYNVERIAQPEGGAQFNPTKSGDCFLCSSYAIISHFYRQQNVSPPPIENVYKIWASDHIKAGNGSSYFSNQKFWQILNSYLDRELKFEMVEDPALDLPDRWPFTFGPQFYTATALQKRVQVYRGWILNSQ